MQIVVCRNQRIYSICFPVSVVAADRGVQETLPAVVSKQGLLESSITLARHFLVETNEMLLRPRERPLLLGPDECRSTAEEGRLIDDDQSVAAVERSRPRMAEGCVDSQRVDLVQ